MPGKRELKHGLKNDKIYCLTVESYHWYHGKEDHLLHYNGKQARRFIQDYHGNRYNVTSVTEFTS